MKNIIYPVIASLLFLTSCNGTWIMYDTDQNDHIYFQDRQQVLIKSFALLADDEIDVEATLYYGNCLGPGQAFQAGERPE